MIFQPAKIAGAYTIDVEPRCDERGSLARTWCVREFAAAGLSLGISQASLVFSHVRGTLRGLHFQTGPHSEEKLLRCTQGAVFVVALDLRSESPTYLCSIDVELSADNRRMLFVPKGCAQGFQTLADNSELFYQMSTPYVPEAAGGVRYDDPAFGIQWPLPVTAISQRDREWPDYLGCGISESGEARSDLWRFANGPRNAPTSEMAQYHYAPVRL
jgi:dTDP-4-dehydrorhamnose 3,5-epimerase